MQPHARRLWGAGGARPEAPGYREEIEVHRTEAAFEGRPARECQSSNPNLNLERRRRATRRACPQVPHPTQPPPVLRNVQEPRPEAATRIPESARRWGAGQLFLIRPGPTGRSLAWDAPISATRPARTQDKTLGSAWAK